LVGNERCTATAACADTILRARAGGGPQRLDRRAIRGARDPGGIGDGSVTNGYVIRIAINSLCGVGATLWRQLMPRSLAASGGQWRVVRSLPWVVPG
jgi:hypothetical protein